jgi:phosphohistidine phosphatase
MRIYLVQHGAAVPKDEDKERPLSASGREDVKRMASFLARSRVSVARVVHSGKRRATETALLLSRVLGPGSIVEEMARGLQPDDPTDDLAAAIGTWTEDAMIVGHLPFVGRLAARLVAGDEDLGVVQFRPGTVACLERGGNGGGWSVAWVVRPELLGG